jgi:pilus assembly protein Flp/PilA
MNARVRRLFADQRGATAIEYGLVASLVAVAIIGAVTAVGGHIGGVFAIWSTDVNHAIGP